MTQIASINPVPVGPAPLPQGLPLEAPLSALPPPTTDVGAPLDQMGELMALMESMGRTSMNESEQSVLQKREQLDKAFAEFQAKLKEAFQKAQEQAQDNGGGLFGFMSDVVDAVAKFVGDVAGVVVGSAAEAVVDSVMAPIDIVAGLIQGQSLKDLLGKEFDDLRKPGKIAGTIEGFSQGVSKFAGDVFTALHTPLAALEAGVTGESVFDALKLQATNLAGSAKTNLIENPDVWEVTSYALKAVAVAGALGTGGTFAGVSVALFALSELEQRYQVANQVFGDKAGPWVSAGIELATTVLVGSAGLGGLQELGNFGEVASALKNTTLIVQGAMLGAQTYTEYKARMEAADAVDQQAELVSSMNRMSRLQRVIESLLGELETKSNDRQRFFEGARQVYATQGAALEATIIRA